jgi:type VI secretion system protein ImpC
MYSWCAAIRGVEGGGMVEGLPTHTFKTDQGDVALKCPTEIAITDRREKELNDLGFVSLCHAKGTDYAVFFGGATAQKAKQYITNDANANARISAMLPYVLAASRFAHYLKVIMRDKIGSFQTRESIQAFLQNWIAQYVLLSDEAPQSAKARYPLCEARVDVTAVPGKPGAFSATVFLKPHFQLEELTASIRLVAELPPPAAG